MRVSKGFTLIETVATLAFIILIFSIGLPTSLNFYRSFTLQSSTETALNSLKKARQDAQLGYQNSNFGVYFDNLNSRFVYYKGASYALRDTAQDQIFSVPSFITFSSVLEFNFAKITGQTSSTGEIFITNGLVINALKVENFGRISFFKNTSFGSQ